MKTLKSREFKAKNPKPEEKEEREIQRLDRGMDWTMDRDKASLHQDLWKRELEKRIQVIRFKNDIIERTR